MHTFLRLLVIPVLLATGIGTALAAPVEVSAVMSPKEQMRLDFKDGSKHFVLLVRREGMAEGSGALAGTAVTEFGMHDIQRGVGGDPAGYLVFTADDGSEAYIKWRVRAVFVPAADGKMKLLDNGYWEVAGGTGRYTDLQGAGTLHIKPASKTDRRFILNGELTGAN